MAVNSYRDLTVWGKAMGMVEACYHLTGNFPRNEEFGLKSQIRRAAVSIPSNIAEGSMRQSPREYCRFLSIALGSTAELETQLELALRLGLLQEDRCRTLLEQCREVGRMLNGIRKSIHSFATSQSPKTQNLKPKT